MVDADEVTEARRLFNERLQRAEKELEAAAAGWHNSTEKPHRRPVGMVSTLELPRRLAPALAKTGFVTVHEHKKP